MVVQKSDEYNSNKIFKCQEASVDLSVRLRKIETKRNSIYTSSRCYLPPFWPLGPCFFDSNWDNPEVEGSPWETKKQAGCRYV